MTDAWLEGQLEAFNRSLLSILERKDLNEFWPVGLPTAATGGAPLLLPMVEGPIHEAASDGITVIPNPTSLLSAYFYAIYGMRELGWDRDRRLRFTQSTFEIIRRSKQSTVCNTDGAHRLRVQTTAVRAVSLLPLQSISGSSEREYTRHVHRLSASLWAYGEALYFFNHRIATERHGPYPSDRADRQVLIRSAYNLSPTLTWPKLPDAPDLPVAIDIVGDYEAFPIRFDAFANPVFMADLTQAALAIGLAFRWNTGECWLNPDIAAIDRVVNRLHGETARLVAAVERMTAEELVRRVLLIMLIAFDEATGKRVQLLSEESVQRRLQQEIHVGRPIAGDLGSLSRYYDIRKEF